MAFFDCLPFLEIFVFISKCRNEAAGKVIESFLSLKPCSLTLLPFHTSHFSSPAQTSPASETSPAPHSLPRMTTRYSLSFLVCLIFVVCCDSSAPVSFLSSAVPKGAVCLDGSAPAYTYVQGSGDGSRSWIVYLQGGGWCYNISDCYDRSLNQYGSSNHLLSPNTSLTSFLDVNCTSNKDFCNWHKLYIYYCDGSSFMSDVKDTKANLSFRGARIFDVMMEEMLSKGMGNAKRAILSGSSAGGLATMLNCDKFHKLFPGRTEVKCISDSGFFIHGKDFFNAKFREKYYAGIIETHELAKSLPPSCTSKRDSNLCLFPEYFAGDIQAPLFIIESSFDAFQLTGLLNISRSCGANITRCNSGQVEIIRDFKKTFIKTLVGLKASSSRGMFVHSCYVHAHIPNSIKWTGIKLGGRSLGQAVADWSFDRSPVRELDERSDLPQYCMVQLLQHPTTSRAAVGLGLRYIYVIIFVCIPFLFL